MSFIEDFTKLQQQTPRIAIAHTNSENCAYTNYSTFNRNCYLAFGTHYSEDAFYTHYCSQLTSCLDCLDVEKSEVCYELVFGEKCYNCNFGSYLMSCSDCDFCYDMANCQNCFLCTCMQNQSYCILNKQLSKEDFAKQKAFLLKMNSTKELLQQLEELRTKVPQRQFFQKNCENCIGTELRNCKNVLYSYRIKNSEDIIYGGTHAMACKSCVDIDNCAATISEDLYNVIGTTNSYGLTCCQVCWFSQNLYYCEHVFNSHDCFGCISRNHAEYEILNKKYSKEEYFVRVAEIKEELKQQGMWGKMWIPSTYPYEDTIASLYYPEQFSMMA
ncbi:hypothetical protein HZA42_04570 [Candidatus Peregrinibacteria bacterium]|nr:hypothetical protein [Candidatus Peregrinibacteria bacterium]